MGRVDEIKAVAHVLRELRENAKVVDHKQRNGRPGTETGILAIAVCEITEALSEISESMSSMFCLEAHPRPRVYMEEQKQSG